ncbi:hypothetical protein E2C01_022155 [Portunus trituberculatus]|uniref:Uncharacterized protein n=1 Tax=Portunus trituberculatus TaxID=210409 RepID=A0A5B7E694_PORTR|nr:hypothetical protein [Portunus trituberculatus]
MTQITKLHHDARGQVSAASSLRRRQRMAEAGLIFRLADEWRGINPFLPRNKQYYAPPGRFRLQLLAAARFNPPYGQGEIRTADGEHNSFHTRSRRRPGPPAWPAGCQRRLAFSTPPPPRTSSSSLISLANHGRNITGDL